jgi:hypothetical protein
VIETGQRGNLWRLVLHAQRMQSTVFLDFSRFTFHAHASHTQNQTETGSGMFKVEIALRR